MNPGRITVLMLSGVLLVYLLAFVLLPSGAFWITDGGNKFILIQNMERFGSINIDYPARDIDPEKRFFPRADFHFQKVGDNIQSFYPPYYPFLALGAYKLLGINGLMLLSLLSMMVVVYLSVIIADALGVDDRWRWTVPVVALCTPFFFYSQVFWEHAFSMIFSSMAFILILKSGVWENGPARRIRIFMLLAGGLMGFSGIFREESYIFFGAVGLSMLLLRVKFRHLAVFGCAWAAVLCPLWIYQYMAYGHVLGIHAVGYNALAAQSSAGGIWDRIILKFSNFYVFLYQFDVTAPPPSKWYMLAALPAILLTFFGICFRNTRTMFVVKSMLAGLYATVSVVLTMLLAGNNDPAINTLFTKGLIAGSPFLLLPLMFFRDLWRKNIRIRFVLMIAVIFAAVTCLFLNQGVLGVIWGARHFLVLFPLLAPVSVWAARKFAESCTTRFSGYAVLTVAVLFMSSLLIQAIAVRTIYIKKTASNMIMDALRSAPAAVVATDIHWLNEDCAPLYFEKQFMQLLSDRDLFDLIAALKSKGVDKFNLVLSLQPQFRVFTNAGMARFHEYVEITAHREIRPPRAGFMDVILVECRIRRD